jgi:hypothetical protein
MRSFAGIAVFAVFAPVVFATSAIAQAPTPKVTLSGLFDQVTSMGRNFYDSNFARNSDTEWYARTRFRPDFEFAVGRVKAVLGLEIDLMYGQGGANDGGFPGNNTGFPGGPPSAGTPTGGTKVQTNGALDLNTDVGGMIEIKWIYTEFPLTGPDSLLPFIPIETMARAGGQPFGTMATYKLATYAASDFAGLSTVTTITPNARLNLGYVIAEDQLAGANRGNPSLKTGRGEDYALIVSPEYTPIKGLDLKPLFSWFHADGVTSIAARRNLVNVRTVGGILGNGTSLAPPVGPPAAGSPSYHEDRYTIGLDTRWRVGPFGLDPTIFYQWGRMDSQAFVSGTGAGVGSKKVTSDLNAFFVDIVGSYQLGPLLFEVRGDYSTGNKARDNLAKGIRYFQPLTTDGIYYAGWAQIMALGVDYFNGVSMAGMGSGIGYDRYGRAQLGFRTTYTIVPPLSFYAVVSPTWTAEKVDTDTNAGLVPGAVGLTTGRLTVSQNSWASGDSSYIGTEADLGMTWRFAPNAAFDIAGGYLFAGGALDTTECTNGAATCNANFLRHKSAKDAYTLAARVRLAF